MPVPIGSACWRRLACQGSAPFKPDTHTREILDQAAKTAYKTSRVIGFEQVVGGISYRIYPDRHWANPFADGTPSGPSGPLNLAWTNTAGGYLVIDARIDARLPPRLLRALPSRASNKIDSDRGSLAPLAAPAPLAIDFAAPLATSRSPLRQRF